MLPLVIFALSIPIQTPRNVDALIKQMTLEEKVSLCHGGTEFGTKAIPRLGIPEFRFTDGPNGVRDQEKYPTTGFPSGISLAATWNPELVKEVGAAMAEEAKGLGKSVILGPAVNIDRTPLGGRTYEYYSEDPYLAGKLAVGFIEGVQSHGVLACVKHFAANSIEKERETVDAQVGEPALHELYLPAFEAAVKEGNVGAVMSSYNKLNGIYTSENYQLLTSILRDEWGFKGLVMSDWGAVHSTAPTALAGLDLEMPGGKNDYLGDPLLKAVRSGLVPESVIDTKVRRILTTLLPYARPTIDHDPKVSTKAHQALARKVADESIVLLQNDGDVLPLDPAKLKSVAVIGPNADATFEAGGGSGSVITPYEISTLAGLKEALGDKVQYEPGCDLRPIPGSPIPSSCFVSPDGGPGLKAEYWSNEHFQGRPVVTRTDPAVDFDWNGASPAPGIGAEHFSVRWTAMLVPQETGTYTIGTRSDDGSSIFMDGKVILDNGGYHGAQTRTTTVQLVKGIPYAVRVRYFQGTGGANMHLFWEKLAGNHTAEFNRAVEAARACDVAIVCVGINHEYDTEGSDKPDLKLMWGGDDLVEAIARVNPRTIVVLNNGTPLEMPSSRVSAIVEAWYPGIEGGRAVADVLLGKVNPSGKLPITFPYYLSSSPAHVNGNYPPKDGILRYDEGIRVGYRYYDQQTHDPLFRFGYGLSYTTFLYDDLVTKWAGAGADVTFSVTNTGRRSGYETAQVYVGERPGKVRRPFWELKGFAKVFLAPGQTKRVRIRLGPRAFMYYSAAAGGWVQDPAGIFDVSAGGSRLDINEPYTLPPALGSVLVAPIPGVTARTR